MATSVNAVFGGSGIFGKPEVRSVVRAMAQAASGSLSSYQPGEDYLLDLYVYVSGDVVQHGQSGVKLGNVGRKSRSLWVRIYVPDDVSSEDQATAYLSAALSEAAELVLDRLRRRAPDWPAQTLATELTNLADSLRRKTP
ncbi:MAG: hypothetical protein J2P27_01185 [Actinobacteria bacterium]|nr:hypothetical protein [Actinomycetota bacterium]